MLLHKSFSLCIMHVYLVVLIQRVVKQAGPEIVMVDLFDMQATATACKH